MAFFFLSAQLYINFVQIKGFRIKRTPDPVQHLLMLGVLWVVDRFEQTGVAPDATAILRRTGPFAREADRIALPLLARQPLFPRAVRGPSYPRNRRSVPKSRSQRAFTRGLWGGLFRTRRPKLRMC